MTARGAPVPSPSRDHHRLIMDATIRLLAEKGYSNLTIEGVAAAAGVGKTTIYRRWTSRAALVGAVGVEIGDRVKHPDTGRPREDLTAYLVSLARLFRTPTATRVIPVLIAVMAEGVDDVAPTLHRVWDARRAILIDYLRRGTASGDLPRDLDAETAADLLYGAIYYRFLISGAPLTPQYVRRLVASVLRACRDPLG